MLPVLVCFGAITAWLIILVPCRMINHTYVPSRSTIIVLYCCYVQTLNKKRRVWNTYAPNVSIVHVLFTML